MEEREKQYFENSNLKKYFNYRNIKRGAIVFFLITLVAFTVLFMYSNTGKSLEALKSFKLEYLGLILVLVYFDWWIGGWRNTIFVRKIIPDAPWRICFDANLANIFMGAVTPSQTGGGPMHLYMLHRGGVKLTDGLALSIINFISTLIFFPLSAGLALWYLQNAEINETLFTLIKSGFTIFTSLFTLIFLGLVIPSQVSKALSWLGDRWGSVRKSSKDKTQILVQKVSEKLHEYNETVRLLIQKNPMLLLYSFVITIIMYFNKYLIAYLLVCGLGIEADFWTVIGIQAVIFFLLYFAPSPGGSGIAELSIAVMMGGYILPESLIATYTILHRTFLIILGAIVGAVIVLRELRKHSLE